MIKHAPFLFLVLIIFTTKLNAQTQLDSLKTVQNPINPEKKLKFGLGTGFNFVGGTSIALSPNLTYQINDKFSAGAGLQFAYNGLKDVQNTTTFGANVLGFYTPIKKLLTLLEFSLLNVNKKDLQTDIKDNFWEKAFFVGAGYQITSKISVGAKYNLLYDKNKSVYTSPVVPFVNIGF